MTDCFTPTTGHSIAGNIGPTTGGSLVWPWFSGHSSDKENPAQTGVIDQRDDTQGRAAVWALEPIDFVDLHRAGN